MNFHSFPLFQKYSDKFVAGHTDKKVGSFKENNPEYNRSVIQLNLGQPVQAYQTHSDIILEVDKIPEQLPEADAYITQTKNLLLLVKVADCQGVVIYDPENQAIGVVHSGWRGSTKNIMGKTIQKMKRSFHSNPEDLLVAISPSLGPCCSEFSNPGKELPSFMQPFFLGDKHVNFWALTKKQCVDEGVSEENIENIEICTKDSAIFYSHRNGDEGRFAVFAQLI